MVGSAWTEWVRPIIAVSASARARAMSTARSRSQSREQPLAGGPELEREPRVDDVAARQAEVQVPALGPDRLGDLADEGDDVVVGRPLDLGDPVDVDRRARLERGERVGGTRPRAAWARATASSTRSIASNRAASVQIAPISASV